MSGKYVALVNTIENSETETIEKIVADNFRDFINKFAKKAKVRRDLETHGFLNTENERLSNEQQLYPKQRLPH